MAHPRNIYVWEEKRERGGHADTQKENEYVVVSADIAVGRCREINVGKPDSISFGCAIFQGLAIKQKTQDFVLGKCNAPM